MIIRTNRNQNQCADAYLVRSLNPKRKTRITHSSTKLNKLQKLPWKRPKNKTKNHHLKKLSRNRVLPKGWEVRWNRWRVFTSKCSIVKGWIRKSEEIISTVSFPVLIVIFYVITINILQILRAFTTSFWVIAFVSLFFWIFASATCFGQFVLIWWAIQRRMIFWCSWVLTGQSSIWILLVVEVSFVGELPNVTLRIGGLLLRRGAIIVPVDWTRFEAPSELVIKKLIILKTIQPFSLFV